MAHHNLRLLAIFCSLLLFFHPALSQLYLDDFPSLQPEQLAPVPWPSQESVPVPAPAPGPSLGLAPVPTPSPSPQESVPVPLPAPSPGPASAPALYPGPAPVPTPFPGPASVPAPSPEWESVPSTYLAWIPSISEPPSSSISPAPAESDSPYQVDSPTALAPSADVNPKVKEICDSTDHSSLCRATAVPLLNGKADDITSVLEVTVKAGAKLAKHALLQVLKSAEQPGNSDELNLILESCTENYETAVINYENAVSAFPRSDKGTMNSMLTIVISVVGDCEDAFHVRGEESPFSSIASRLTNMTSNCLAIISRLD